MAVPILQTLVGLIFVLLGMALAARPLTTKTEQWLCRAIFICLGSLLLALSWIQYRSEQRKETAFRAKIQALNTNQIVVQPPLEKGSGIVESNQFELQQKYQSVLTELATNPSLAPNLRERIIIATAKIGRDAQALKLIPSDEALSAAQSAKDKILPYFDYAIKSLEAMSEKEAGLKGDKSVLIYLGLPEDLSPDAKEGKRSRKNAAEIKFRANTDWDFQIYFAEAVTPQYEASLSIICKGGVLVLKNTGDSIETKIQVLSGDSSGHEPASGDEAKANIADSLGKLMVSELEAMEAKR